MKAKMKAKMKALVLKGQGGWDRLAFAEVAEPWPLEEECVVQVHAVGLSANDVKMVSGAADSLRTPSFPTVPGVSLSGVVVRRGDRVTRFREGDAVVASLGGALPGAFSERCRVLACELAPKPRGLSFEESAGVPAEALLAWQGVHEVLALSAGDTLLVATGVYGALSCWVVQVAKQTGARVVVVGPPARKKGAQELGAHAFFSVEEEETSGLYVENRPTAAFLALPGESAEAVVARLPPGARVVNCEGPVPPGAALPGSGPKESPVGQGARSGVFLRLRRWRASLSLRRLARERGVAYDFVSFRSDGGQLEALCMGLEQGCYVAQTERVYEFHDAVAALKAYSESPAEGAVVVRMPIAWRQRTWSQLAKKI